MLISKFDLYKSEWLELVFDSRNKAYGAYDLRQHYAGTMVRAMGITFLGVGLLFGAGMVSRSKSVTPPPLIVGQRTPVQLTAPPVKPPVPPKREAQPVKPPAPVKTQQY